MPETITLEQVHRELRMVNRKLSMLLNPQNKKQTWVKATDIMQLTGWDREEMRRARLNNKILWKKEKVVTLSGEKQRYNYWYLLESINELFLIPQKHG